MKLIIDRKQWRRGPQTPETVNNDPTALLCKDGTKCCLGFYALQCGLSEEAIRGAGEPVEVEGFSDSRDWEKLIETYEEDDGSFSAYKITALASDAIDINDSNIPEQVREDLLTKRFAAEGIEVEFHG